ncbi:hypothetical protein Golax_002214 [Gossypium laxum]|uniref:NB-ARC domain-containing protein n=1 Tax=Gossypium laxum TaxID=34288 RepID=A0A7J9AQP4_9ROSI|nr:hypothetical protein [Gossypium laxum]
MDGVGNTTLAHLIYNDGACKCFDPKVWVDQSYDDLDVANETLLNMRKCNNIVYHWEGLKFAFMAGAPGSKSKFGRVHQNVIKKCRGSPLETMVLGGLLNFEERDEWENILNGNLWSLHGEEDADIAPVLRLSYHYLPSHLKRCFAYYSILKKYEFEKIELILLWMVEGLIEQGEEN